MGRCRGYDLLIVSGPDFDPYKCRGFYFPIHDNQTERQAAEAAEKKMREMEGRGYTMRLEKSGRYTRS